MKVVFDENAWDDLLHLQQQEPNAFAKTVALIKDCRRSPYSGIGKPEPLKHELRGWWSRRISGEHRLIYRISGTADDRRLEIIQCRFHY